jgi:membrane protein implicated in regulation of membrane protease activity
VYSRPVCATLTRVALLVALLLAFFVLSSPWNVLVVLGGALLEIVEITWGLKLARRRKRTGVELLSGRRGQVVKPLDPVGQVMLDGERWTARSATPVPAGATVVVERVDGITLVVAPEP